MNSQKTLHQTVKGKVVVILTLSTLLGIYPDSLIVKSGNSGTI